MEDDEFQKILDITIFAPPSSNLRIANYQRLLNVAEYDILKSKYSYEGINLESQDFKDMEKAYNLATDYVDNMPVGTKRTTYHKKKKRKKKK